MNWEALGALAESVGAVGVIATLIYLAVQVRHNTRAVRAATYDSFVGQFREWNEPFRSDPKLTSLFSRSLEEIEDLEPEARQHALHMFFDLFKLAENLHYQYRVGMIERPLWKGWEVMFRTYLTAPGTTWYWNQRRSMFASEFADWMDSIEEPEDVRRVGHLAQG